MAKARKKDGDVAEPGFEQSLERLEAIVAELEGGDLALERAIELFEEGVLLGRRCGSRLDEAEKKITLLLQAADGTLQEKEFSAEAAAAEEPPPRPASPKAPARRSEPATPRPPVRLPMEAEGDGEEDDDDLPF